MKSISPSSVSQMCRPWGFAGVGAFLPEHWRMGETTTVERGKDRQGKGGREGGRKERERRKGGRGEEEV